MKKIAISLIFAWSLLLLPVYGSAETYFKTILPEDDYPMRWPGINCDERTDLVLVDSLGNVVDKTNPLFVPQYDPILSTSVLCPLQFDPLMIIPVTDYINTPPHDAYGVANKDGTPLQSWGVVAYCAVGNGEIFPEQRMPVQVILHCLKADGAKKKKNNNN